MQLYTSVQLSFSDSGKAANIIYRLTAQFTGAEGSHKGSLIVTQTGTMLMQQLVAERCGTFTLMMMTEAFS